MMFHSFKLAYFMALQDIRIRYRRTLIGPLWIALSSGILIVTIGFVFGSFVDVDFNRYFVSVSCGVIFWQFLSNSINDCCYAFIHAEPLIKQLKIPYFVHVLRVLFRNLFALLHAGLILPFVFLFFGEDFYPRVLFFLINFFIVFIVLFMVGNIVALVSARFRDLSQVISSVLQVLFYATPVMWLPDQVFVFDDVAQLLLFNPFFHLIELLRGPLMNVDVSDSLRFTLVAFPLLVVFSLFASFRYSKYLPYWI